MNDDTDDIGNRSKGWHEFMTRNGAVALKGTIADTNLSKLCSSSRLRDTSLEKSISQSRG